MPSAESPIADLVKGYPIHSRNVIAHIRKATQGVVSLENCHPFQRELWGRYWIFAHNGDLKDFDPGPLDVYQPVGNTDSELAFCAIMTRLRRLFPDGQPALPALYKAVADLVARIAPHGIFNFLLSNGEVLFAHCSTNLHYIVRRAPFTTAHLVDEDVSVDFSRVTTLDDRVAVIATQPLTDNEQWVKIQPGELLMFRDGERVAV
jgi:glutamine amidotransferase